MSSFIICFSHFPFFSSVLNLSRFGRPVGCQIVNVCTAIIVIAASLLIGLGS